LALRCVYTDLDGTLLGERGSLFRDSDGNFSLLQARALEACHRSGVEVVIKSGRREAQVLEDARLIGGTAYIYEAGCGIVIDGERTLLTGDWQPNGDRTVAEQIHEAGVADLLFERFPDRLEYHSPWHADRVLSHLFRGKIDVAEANQVLAEQGHEDLRFIDNGAIARPLEGMEGPAHAYHLMPAEASKVKAVTFHMRARGYEREQCIAVGDSIEDLTVAEVVSRFFVPANGPERDPGLRDALAGLANVTVTEGRNGDGFYEAIVSTLAGT
jgi:hydroxymethylpyrimidine pyrophosphatase-like HAD family hydrolase